MACSCTGSRRTAAPRDQQPGPRALAVAGLLPVHALLSAREGLAWALARPSWARTSPLTRPLVPASRQRVERRRCTPRAPPRCTCATRVAADVWGTTREPATHGTEPLQQRSLRASLMI